KGVEFISNSCYYLKLQSAVLTYISDIVSERRKMSTQNLPAPSLSTGCDFPAVRLVRRVVNYLIYRALWLILPAISGAEPNFLPALKEVEGMSTRNARWLDCVPRRAGGIDRRWMSFWFTARICMSMRIAIWPPTAGTARQGYAGCWRPREHERWISFCWPV